jgi:hypothetical protein
MVPTYLTALWFWHAIEVSERRASPAPLFVHAAGYLFLSMYLEMVLLTIPLLGLLAWAWGARSHPRSRSFYAKLALAYAVMTLLATLVYVVSPGQQYRVKTVGVTLPGTDATPMLRLLRLVPVGYFGLGAWAGALAYAAVVVLLLVLVFREWRRRRPGSGTGAALLFVAHVAAVSPALSMDLPARTVTYTAVLLVTSFGLALFAAVASARSRWLTAGLLLLTVLAAGTVQVRECAAVQRTRREFFRTRQRVFSYVLGLHDYSGANAFVLTDCDPAPDRQPFEPPWGLQAYFRWARSRSLLVFVDSNYDYPQRPLDREYTVVSCRAFAARGKKGR